MADVVEHLKTVADRIQEHLRQYIESDGREGYYYDASHNPGADPRSLALVLRTIGRKSGKTQLAPLIFNWWKDEAVIVASKGGSDQHPAWYLNLVAQNTVDVQIKNKRYRCTWRIAEGEERQRIWNYMADYFPPYRDYQKRTTREIPVVLLAPGDEIEEKFDLGDSAGVDTRTRS